MRNGHFLSNKTMAQRKILGSPGLTAQFLTVVLLQFVIQIENKAGHEVPT